jgi:hypothetical protein
LPPVSTTLAKLEAKFAAGVADTSDKFATSVVDTGGNFAAGVVNTGGAPLLRKLSKKFETVLTGYSGAGGNWFMKKTRSKKSRDTVPLNSLTIYCMYFSLFIAYFLQFHFNARSAFSSGKNPHCLQITQQNVFLQKRIY